MRTNGAFPVDVIKRNWRTLFILVALVIDFTAIVLSNVFAFLLYPLVHFGLQSPAPPFIGPTLLFCGVLIFLGLVLGLYRAAYNTKMHHQYSLGAKVYLYGIVLILALLYLTRETEYPRLCLALFFVALPVCFVLLRSALNHFNLLMQRRGLGVFNALIVEYNHTLDEVLMNRFTSFPELGYRVQTHIVKKPNETAHTPAHSLSDLNAILEREHVDTIFIPTLDIIENGYSDLIGFCEQRKVKLKVLSKESDDLLRFAYLTDLAGISLSTPPRLKTEFVKRIAKRAFDITFSLLGLALFSPIFIVVSVAILLEDGLPVFFKQSRSLTKKGKQFTFLKFRSMSRDAEYQQAKLSRMNKRTGGLFLVHDDPRVTMVGRIIRKFSIDELPQLFNVLVGDMSLVGPRPLSIRDLSNITTENRLGGYYTLREKAKPGMTGLWQISGRREVGFREMVLLDLYYIEHQTILFDLEILAHTIPVVLFGRGAY